MSTRSLALAAALVALAPALAAHDHWLAPSSFAPAVGQRVDVRLCVGHPSKFEEQPRDPRRAVRFEMLSASGTQPLIGLDGRSPAAFFATRAPGSFLLVYESNHAFVEIAPDVYGRFLEEEGLDDVRAERERRGELDRPGRDSYLRCDKTLLTVGGAATSGFDRVVGLPIELVLETDPGAWSQGDALVLRLELAEQPLADRQVKLMRLEAPHTISLAGTDAEGRVRFRPDAGNYVASALHQRRATSEQALEGDWEGLWASFAFALTPSSASIAADSSATR